MAREHLESASLHWLNILSWWWLFLNSYGAVSESWQSNHILTNLHVLGFQVTFHLQPWLVPQNTNYMFRNFKKHWQADEVTDQPSIGPAEITICTLDTGQPRAHWRRQQIAPVDLSKQKISHIAREGKSNNAQMIRTLSLLTPRLSKYLVQENTMGNLTDLILFPN